jgi:flagellar FliL protein
MADPLLIETDEQPKKKKSMVSAIIVPVLLLALSGGLGFSFSKFYVSPMIEANAAAAPVDVQAANVANAAASIRKSDEPAMAVVALDPILTNLSDPSEVWVRAEFSVLFNDAPSADVTAKIHDNFLRYMKTVKLRNLEGAIGFEHMLEDLNERARLISGGKAGRVLVRAFIVQ